MKYILMPIPFLFFLHCFGQKNEKLYIPDIVYEISPYLLEDYYINNIQEIEMQIHKDEFSTTVFYEDSLKKTRETNQFSRKDNKLFHTRIVTYKKISSDSLLKKDFSCFKYNDSVSSSDTGFTLFLFKEDLLFEIIYARDSIFSSIIYTWTNFQRDSENKIKSYKVFWGDDKTISELSLPNFNHFEYYYNKENQVDFIKKWTSDPTHSFQSNIKLEYNKNLISRIKYNRYDPETCIYGLFPDGRYFPFANSDSEFEYDSQGNWIKLYDYDVKKKKKKLRLERIITYK